MALLYPDILQHNNPALPLMDDAQLGGGMRVVDDIAARDAIPVAKRKIGALVSYYANAEWHTHRFEGTNTSDGQWTTESNWLEILTASGSIAGNLIQIIESAVHVDPTYLRKGLPRLFADVDVVDCISANFNMQYIVIGGRKFHTESTENKILLSSDNGSTWVELVMPSSTGYATAIAMSSDSQYIYWSGTFDLYVSNDYGATWTAKGYTPARSWVSACCSDNGTYVAFLNQNNAQVAKSTNNGVSFTNVTLPDQGYNNYLRMAGSASGQYLTAVINVVAKKIARSDDYGATWTVVGTSDTYIAIAVSPTGEFQVATTDYGLGVWISSDYGATWAVVSSNYAEHYLGATIDTTGQVIVVNGRSVVNSATIEHIERSDDGGATWTELSIYSGVNDIISTTDGTKFIVIGSDLEYWVDGVDTSLEFPRATHMPNWVLYPNHRSLLATRGWIANQIEDAAQLTVDELAAVNGANNPSAANVFATMADLAGGGQTYAAGDGITITPGSPDDIISADLLTDDELDAIQGANNPSVSNVFATMDDLTVTGQTYAAGDGIVITPGSPDYIISSDLLTIDELAAINGAALPTALNVFATMADLPDAITINNNADNRIITGSATANTLNGESDLTFATGILSVTGNFRASNLADAAANWIISDADGDISIGSIAASETVSGVLEIATSAEVITGTDNGRAVSPAGLQEMTASTTRDGIVELATDSETLALTDTAHAVTPSNLGALDSSATQMGLVELATQAEVDAGTDTARVVTARTLRGTKKFTVTVGMQAAFNPADGTSYYWGIASNGGVTSTTSEQFAIRCAGEITGAVITWNAAGTAGSNEVIPIYVRVNGVATLIAQVGSTDAIKIFQNEAMSVTVADNDLIAFRVICPTWATNPTTVRITGYITFEGA